MPCKKNGCTNPVSMRAESAEITYCDDCLLSAIHRTWKPLAPKPSECVGFDGQGCPRGLPRHKHSDSMCASCEYKTHALMLSAPGLDEDAVEAECETWMQRGGLDHQKPTIPPYALNRQPAKLASIAALSTAASVIFAALCCYVLPLARRALLNQ